MAPNILVTGAAGYIGGSLVAGLINTKHGLFPKENLFAVVRSNGQAAALSGIGVNVLGFNLHDGEGVAKALVENNINIVVHTASSIDPAMATNLIDGLAKTNAKTGDAVNFLHTSGTSAVWEDTGWPEGMMPDTGPIFETEKELADSFPVRSVDVTVIEHAETQGVASYIVMPSVTYGRGSGPWNQLSVVSPTLIKGTIGQGQVRRFNENTRVSGVHITDMVALYTNLIQKILSGNPPANGKKSYYFAFAHDIFWHEALEHLAAALKARGLVNTTDVEVWSSNEAASKALGFPEPFVPILWDSGENVKASTKERIGWTPQFDKKRFLDNLHTEIQDVLDLGEAKSSLMASLRNV